MASFLDPTYNVGRKSSSSGAEVNDLVPERRYSVDTRRLDSDARNTAVVADTANESKQDRAGKFFRAAKAAGKYRIKSSIDYPLGGNAPSRNPKEVAGTVTPSLGESMGPGGSTAYARKPQRSSGRDYNYLDSFT